MNVLIAIDKQDKVLTQIGQSLESFLDKGLFTSFIEVVPTTKEINLDENGSLTNVHERVLGGDFLMNAGIRINWKNAFQSVCMEVTETGS